jgi:hypothetical protein
LLQFHSKLTTLQKRTIASGVVTQLHKFSYASIPKYHAPHRFNPPRTNISAASIGEKHYDIEVAFGAIE